MLLWIDIATPKYALFFSKMIPLLKERNFEVLVTTRFSTGYDEVKKVLDFLKLDYLVLGNYGGSSIKEKFNARLKRQSEFVDIFEKKGYPKALICGSSVEGVQTAFGLGIPVIHFADTPIRGYEFKYEDMTILSKLTIPLSSLVFHPFVVPSDVYVKFGLDPKNVIKHDFIDVCLWMDDIVKKDENDFRKKYNLDISKPTILIREEEYKAHYVKEKLPIIYNLIPKIKENFDVNIVIMPRYESDYLKEEFSNIVTILEDKLKPEEFYPFIDLLLGGGGTMNLEASYFGIPVVSTRSLLLYHDKYLIENDLMSHVQSEEEALKSIEKLLGVKKDNKEFFCKEKCGFKTIIEKIERFLV
jgi:predicted glycosyltransferase